MREVVIRETKHMRKEGAQIQAEHRNTYFRNMIQKELSDGANSRFQ